MSSSNGGQPSGSGKRFRCPQCRADFSRPEHLARHQLSHDDNKPFCCQDCDKKFTRRDTLKRHMVIHASTGPASKRSSPLRVAKACAPCARLRLRCDGNNPCDRCTSKGVQCAYVPGSRRRVRPNPQEPAVISATPTDSFHPDSRTPGPAAEDDPEHEWAVSLSAAPELTIHVAGGLDMSMSSSSMQATEEQQPAPDRGSASPGNGLEEEGGIERERLDGLSALCTLTQVAIDLEARSTRNQYGTSIHPSMGMENDMMLSGNGYTDSFQLTQGEHDGPSPPQQRPEITHHRSHDIGISDVVAADPLLTPPTNSADHPSTGYMHGSTTALDTSTDTEPMDLAMAQIDCAMPWNHEMSVIDWISPQSTSLDDYGLLFAHANTPSMLLSGVQLSWPAPHSTGANAAEPQQLCGPGPPSGMAATNVSRGRTDSAELPESQSHSFSNPSGAEGRAAAAAVDKVHQWPTDWEPTRRDNLVAFPDMNQVVMDDILDAEDFAHVESMGAHCYDMIASCLRRHSSGETRHFRAFRNAKLPGRRAMDCFVQLYFEHFQTIFPLLHQGTFDPSREPWQLVLAVAAIGCRYSQLPGSPEFANALQELLRRAIADTIEADNSAARELWLCRCIMLNGLGMTYSGNNRLLEIAETFRNGPPTMIRRSGCLARNFRPSSRPSSTDTATDLEARWREWIADESFRRLGFCAYLSDAQIAMHLDFMPCMSASELLRPIPHHDVLWEAATAQAWRDRQVQYGLVEYETPTVQAVMQMLSEGKGVPRSVGDFARLIVVLATYQTTFAMSNQLRSPLLPSLTNTAEHSPEALSENATMIMERLASAEPIESNTALVRSSLNCHIILELMLFHVHRRDMLSFAHSFNTDAEDPDVRHRLILWIRAQDGKRARRAVVYAGSLLTALSKNATRAPHEPIAALLAILVLWTYNKLVGEQRQDGGGPGGWSSGQGGGAQERGNVVRLDRPRSNAEIQAWCDGKKSLRPYLPGVGTISRPGAGPRLLHMGGEMLLDMDVWALSQGWASWLGKLAQRSKE